MALGTYKISLRTFGSSGDFAGHPPLQLSVLIFWKKVEKQKVKNFCQITMSYFGLIDVRIKVRMSASEKEQSYLLHTYFLNSTTFRFCYSNFSFLLTLLPGLWGLLVSTWFAPLEKDIFKSSPHNWLVQTAKLKGFQIWNMYWHFLWYMSKWREFKEK